MGWAWGGYIWHTTGSGKTMTSFNTSSQRLKMLIKSFSSWIAWYTVIRTIQQLCRHGWLSTENTHALISKLKSTNPNWLLAQFKKWVISSKKMVGSWYWTDAKKAHRYYCRWRSTFGDMLITIKETFPQALVLQGHRFKPKMKRIWIHSIRSWVAPLQYRRWYSRVLGFDPYLISTYKDSKLR